MNKKKPTNMNKKKPTNKNKPINLSDIQSIYSSSHYPQALKDKMVRDSLRCAANSLGQASNLLHSMCSYMEVIKHDPAD